MITIKELAEVVVKHMPENETDTVEKIVDEIEDALAENDESANAMKNIVEEIWQRGYDAAVASKAP